MQYRRAWLGKIIDVPRFLLGGPDHPLCCESSEKTREGECFGAVLVQTGGRCMDARFQAPLDSTYPQLMLKTGTGERKGGREGAENNKGCDIGYALAVSSCEGANNVDACTVTALDAITVFTVPNPNCSSQS